MQSFSSSSASLHEKADKKSKRKLLPRLSLRPKTATGLASTSSSASLASRSMTSLALSPEDDIPSRRALDMFSSGPSRRGADAYASMPSTPKTPKTPRSKSCHDVRAAPSTRSTSASIAAMSSRSSAVPPVPEIPKTFLISDEVFVIAAAPTKLPEKPKPTSVRMSKSYSSPSSQSMALSASSQSSGSWVENLGSSASEEEAPDFEETLLALKPEEEPEAAARSSLDDIDDQIVLNLCLNLCELTPTENVPRCSEDDDSTPKEERYHSRGASEPSTLSAAVRSKPLRTHTRTASAPLSLGPLPPQPLQPPTEAILRKTDEFKKRHSKQQSPVLAFTSPRFNQEAFSRSAPTTPKLDSISDLKHLELDLSLDSRMAKRNHQRSLSKTSSKMAEPSYFDLPGQVKLTPGHIAGPTFDEEIEERHLVSRWSEDSDGEDARKLFTQLLSPVLGSKARFNSVFTSSSDLSTRAKTPEMIATRHSSSSSSTSSLSDLSEPMGKEEVFDLSRPSLDYRTVYALAQAYAKTSNAAPTMARSKSHKPVAVGKRSLRRTDPADRSYHLRK